MNTTCPLKHLICIVGAADRACDAMVGLPHHVDFEWWPSLSAFFQRTELTCPALILVRLETPDQYHPRDVARLFEQFPTSRVVCSASAWCASVNRSRGVWPVSVVISELEFDDRIALERRILEGDAAPVLVTGDREEAVRSRFEAPGCGSVAGRLALVVSKSATMAAWISSLLSSLGVRTTASAASPPDWLVIDGDPWSSEGQRRIESERKTFSALPVVVMTDRLIPEQHPAAEVDAFPISKFASLAEWSRLLNSLAMLLVAVLIAGCGAPSSSPALPSERHAADDTWSERLEQVRSGASRRLVVEGPLTAEQWRELKTGCENLEALEVNGSDVSNDDLEVLVSLPRLKRLVLDAPVDDAGADVLARCASLTEVNLPCSQITDAGLAHLAGLRLRQLRIGSSQITDAGIASLGSQEDLRFLHLINVPITDASLDTLKGITSLQSLYLDNARCTDEGLSEFIRARPNVHFHRDQMHLRNDPHADGH